MGQHQSKQEIIDQLRKDILLLQGFKSPELADRSSIGLGAIEAVFPNSVFPKAAVHEFLIALPEHAAASGGFIAGLLKVLMKNGNACLWISASRTLFPPALKAFGVTPDRVIFIDLHRERDVLWATEEALKCEGIIAVIAELDNISFAQSRRLQLVVEKSKVTGFVLRKDDLKIGNTASAARWQIKPLPTAPEMGLPGLGHPRWNVELLKVRNGQTGSWIVEWTEDRFQIIAEQEIEVQESTKKTG